MSGAPKRIWANTCVWDDGKPLAGEWNHKDVDSFLDTPYVRADISDEMLEALEEYLPVIEALEAAGYWAEHVDGTGIATANKYRAAIAKARGGNA